MGEFTLIPEPDLPRGVGEHGEEVLVKNLELAITRCIELADALSDGDNSLMSWIDRLEEAERLPTYAELREIVRRMYGQAAKIQFALTKARASH